MLLRSYVPQPHRLILLGGGQSLYVCVQKAVVPNILYTEVVDSAADENDSSPNHLSDIRDFN